MSEAVTPTDGEQLYFSISGTQEVSCIGFHTSQRDAEQFLEDNDLEWSHAAFDESVALKMCQDIIAKMMPRIDEQEGA